MADYTEQLRQDLVEQFKEKPVIDALISAIGEQLTDLHWFFTALQDERGILTAIGKQLDGVGDIVCLSRVEAGALACVTEPVYVLDDEQYRNYLIFKIWKNTNNCTYPELIKAFRMFWDKPLYYSENPEYPAVMFLETGLLAPEDHAENLLSAPIIKAADKLSALIKCQEEKNSGNREFDRAMETTLASLREMALPEADAFLEEFFPAYSLTLDDQAL